MATANETMSERQWSRRNWCLQVHERGCGTHDIDDCIHRSDLVKINVFDGDLMNPCFRQGQFAKDARCEVLHLRVERAVSNKIDEFPIVSFLLNTSGVYFESIGSNRAGMT